MSTADDDPVDDPDADSPKPKDEPSARLPTHPDGGDITPLRMDAPSGRLPDEPERLFDHIIASSWRGPVPPASEFAEYERVLPGSAERLLKLSELGREHQREVELLIARAQIADIPAEREERKRGQLYGLIIGMTCTIGGTICIICGHPVAGTLFGSSAVIGLVSIFVLGRNAKGEKGESMERESKHQRHRDA